MQAKNTGTLISQAEGFSKEKIIVRMECGGVRVVFWSLAYAVSDAGIHSTKWTVYGLAVEVLASLRHQSLISARIMLYK